MISQKNKAIKNYAVWLRSKKVNSWVLKNLYELENNFDLKKLVKEELIALSKLVEQDSTVAAYNKFLKKSPLGLITYVLIFDPNSETLGLHRHSRFIKSKITLKYSTPIPFE